MTDTERDLRNWVQPTPAVWPIPKPEPPPPETPDSWLNTLRYLILVPLLIYAGFSYLKAYGQETVPWDLENPDSMGYWGHGMSEKERIEAAAEYRATTGKRLRTLAQFGLSGYPSCPQFGRIAA